MLRSAVFLSLLSALGFVTWVLVQEDSPLFRPIQQYELVSDIHHVKPTEIDNIMQRYLGRSFWEVELETIQSELTRLDWVSSALVKRSWPAQLYVSVQEQKPVVRWQQTGLVNQAGIVFYPNDLTGFNNLVVLKGPLADSAKILVRLSIFQTALKSIEFTIAALSLQLDGIWEISLLDGSKIILDRKDGDAKLDQFVRAYPKLSMTLRKSPQVYDLRYSNGFIVGQL
ncbi:MAG: cell division protein FtsQ/DivIB [Pseudomonadota bacterium]